jgi:hypothetical protein
VNVTAVVISNFVIGFLIVAAIIGVPLWLTFKRKHSQPDYSEARAHYQAKAAAAQHTSDFVPSTPVPVADGLTIARQHLAPRTMVPGRRHAAEPAVRTHAPQATPRTAGRSSDAR